MNSNPEITVEFVREPHTSFYRFTCEDRCVVADPETNKYYCWHDGNIVTTKTMLGSALNWLSGK